MRFWAGAAASEPGEAGFRAGVRTVVRDGSGFVLALARRQESTWQLPQGGLHHDEPLAAAAWRELPSGPDAEFVARKLVAFDELLATAWAPRRDEYERVAQWCASLDWETATPHHRPSPGGRCMLG